MLPRLAATVLVVLGLNATAFGATDWFKAARENHMDFGLMSRTYGKPSAKGKQRPYVLLTAGRGGPLINPRPVELPETEVLAAVNSALGQAGFPAASSADEAELAIVVVYGMGEYPPPFEFMGIDPLVVPSFRWPRLLKEYEQRFFRRDYEDAVELRYVRNQAATESDLFNFIGIRAFDAEALRKEKKWTLVWETRVTIDAVNRPLADHFGVMLTAASEVFGEDERNGSVRSAPIRNGVVMLGEIEVVESQPETSEAAR
jgi:hypothetical protein